MNDSHYLHGGFDGNEALLNKDDQGNIIYAPQADEVKAGFEKLKN